MTFKTNHPLLIHNGADEQYPIIGVCPAGSVVEGILTIGEKYVWMQIGSNSYIKKGVPQNSDYLSSMPTGFSRVSLNSVVHFCDGFDSPVGTKRERGGSKLWPGEWVDTNPFRNLYMPGTTMAYHTGSDLTLHGKSESSHRGRPVHSIASGCVTCATELKSWGYVVVVLHDPIPCDNNMGIIVSSRYAHLDSISIMEGDRVERGDKLGILSKFNRRGPFHVHFDISHSNILLNNPGHWPGGDLNSVYDNYINPIDWILGNRPKQTK